MTRLADGRHARLEGWIAERRGMNSRAYLVAERIGDVEYIREYKERLTELNRKILVSSLSLYEKPSSGGNVGAGVVVKADKGTG